MNLEIKEKTLKDNSKDYDVYLDGVLIGKADDFGDEGSEFLITTDIKFLETSKNYSVNEFLKENLFAIIFPINFKKFDQLKWNIQGINDIWFEEDEKIVWYAIPDLINWNKPFTFISFLEKLSDFLLPHNIFIDFKDANDILQSGFNISKGINSENNFQIEYEDFLSVIEKEISNAFENLTYFNTCSISERFNFPEEIRQVCEQYLIYFSKFLEDYGIEVSALLESKNGDTIFTIEPKDDIEALQKIRDLLSFYLSLPNVQNLEILSNEYKDVSVQQLLANIYHLKSQLLLATSMIESKDATIESLKFSNFQKQTFIEQNITKNEEKTLDGLVSIQEFEYKGFKLNLPEIFRRMKRVISKK